MSLGCAGCGDCCNPVRLDPENALKVAVARLARTESMEEPPTSPTESLPFILDHWTELDRTENGVTYSCDQYDPGTRRCLAHDQRPDVCRGFPWYGDVIKTGDRFGDTTRCSYMLELAPYERPAGSRPLIPLTVRSTP